MKIITALLILVVLTSFSLTGHSTYTETHYVNAKSDTLEVVFTYWWPSGGPFITMCGQNYSMVFTGTVTKLYAPSKNEEVTDNLLYTSQEGIIQIQNILVQKPAEVFDKKSKQRYRGESYFRADCFYESGFKEGDKVMVFIYSYEGWYSMPSRSIVKIENFNDPAVLSIKKFIGNNQDPLSIRADTTLWDKYGYGFELKEIINCKLFNSNQR